MITSRVTAVHTVAYEAVIKSQLDLRQLTLRTDLMQIGHVTPFNPVPTKPS